MEKKYLLINKNTNMAVSVKGKTAKELEEAFFGYAEYPSFSVGDPKDYDIYELVPRKMKVTKKLEII